MSFWDSDAGYDIRDIKHPDYAENMRAHADDLRKRDKEEGCAACQGDPEAHGRHVCGKEDFA